jgi:hypothetical protein
MAAWHVFLAAALYSFPAAAGPPVEIDTLKGDRHAGELVTLDASTATLKIGGNSATIPLAEILEVRFPAAPPPEPSSGARLALLDGTRLTLNSFSVSADQARCESSCGSFTLPVGRLSHVRFGISTNKLDEAWNALLKRESKNDLLVVKKEDVLDFLAGTTGDVGEKISLLLDGDEVPVARDKVYGIIYHRRAPSLPKTIGEVRLAGGDVLAITRFAWDGSDLKVRLATGADLSVPVVLLSALDFSSGKILYLSDVEPRDVKYIPFFDIVHEFRRDRSLDGTPLTLAGKTYSRGLALHSRTTLRYRIGGDYKRLQAVAGIDDSVRRGGKFNVRLVIKGDGVGLFDAEVKTEDPPLPLDLDVTGVRDLEILVDFGSDMLDICDHLDLAGAKVVK